MGGNALNSKGVYTKRFTTDVLFDVYKDISKYLKGYEIDYCKFYRNKNDHGDLDVMVKSDSTKDLVRIIEEEIKPDAHYYNDNVLTFNYGDYQVDLIVIPPKMWDISRVYYSYDPVGNLLGKIARGFGLNYGKDGLYYRSIERRSTEKIYLSQDPHEIYEFLGYDYERFKKGFDDIKEIFDYMISGKFFDKKLFYFENLDGRDRKRNRKRKTFNEFLSYMGDRKSKFDFDTMENKLEYVEEHFNGFLDKVSTHKKKDGIVNKKYDKFGEIVSIFKKGGLLISTIDLYKRSRGDEFIEENSVIDLREDFADYFLRHKDLVRMLDKEFRFGKKMGSVTYFHKNYIHIMPIPLMKKCLKLLPKDFEYTIIKWDKKTDDVSFINTYDFDNVEEPVLRDSYRIVGDTIKYRKETNRKQIYHHKWMFVKHTYKGFNYIDSKLRSLDWYKKK